MTAYRYGTINIGIALKGYKICIGGNKKLIHSFTKVLLTELDS